MRMIRVTTIQIGILVLGCGLLGWTGAPASQRPGTGEQGSGAIRVPTIPQRVPAPPEPRTLPVVHRTEGFRTAGYGTNYQRTFELRARGYLCGDEGILSGEYNRPIRLRNPLTLETRPGDWNQQIRIALENVASFRIIIDSGHPASFDVFDFVDVLPGTYVFALGSLECWRGPVDVRLEFRARTIASRTVYAEVMALPLREDPSQKKRAPDSEPSGALHVSRSQ